MQIGALSKAPGWPGLPVRSASSEPLDTLEPARELPLPRVTAFMQKPGGFQQVQRVQAHKVWPLEAKDDSEPSFLCLRRNYGERLAAFNSSGELLWEHPIGSCGQTDDIRVCSENNTVYSFDYRSVLPLDLKTGQRKAFGDGPRYSHAIFANQDGHLIMVEDRKIWVRDEKMRTLSKAQYDFSYSRVDHDPGSRLLTFQGENYKKDGEFRHYVMSETGQLLFDEPRLTIHPGFSDAEGRLLQVIADPKDESFEVLRLDPRDGSVRRFPVEPGVLAAYPLENGDFATLRPGRIDLRDQEARIRSSAELPEEGLAGVSATRDGVLLTFCDEQKATRVLAFNGELQEVYSGPDLALTAALPDGGILVVHKDGVDHYSQEGTRSFPDPWTAEQALGPLQSYHLELPILHHRGRRGWSDLWNDAERLLGCKPPADLPVRFTGGALEIVSQVSEDEARSRLGLSQDQWQAWNTPPSEAGKLQRQSHELAQRVLHDRVSHGKLDPETWRSAQIFAGYRDEPTAVTEGLAGRNKLLCLGTRGGQVSLLNLSPQGAQTHDHLPAPVVRTELTNQGMVALDQQGNYMMIEPQTWKDAALSQVEQFNPLSKPDPVHPKSLEITDTTVQVGGVRVKRRG